jgi:mutator protein MutT
VGAVLRDSGGRLLLVQRAHEPAAGTWSIPGGRVEDGESDHEAVAREVLEETGLVVAPGELIGTVLRDGPRVVYEIYDYACLLVSGELVAGTDAADARWVAPADLSGLRCAPELVDTLRDWKLLPPDLT